ncbi:MAG TPA: hypothetical protein VGF69_07105 [Thermoanaerobaculia bacterium]|jgi:hypothetical protein
MDMDELRAAKSAAKAAFSEIEGVQGFGIGDNVVRAYVRNEAVASALPEEIDGVPLECVVVGEIVAAEG